MNDLILRALVKAMPKLERMPEDKQVKLIWLLLLAMLADLETAKALLENREAPDHSDIHKELELMLTKVFLEI